VTHSLSEITSVLKRHRHSTMTCSPLREERGGTRARSLTGATSVIFIRPSAARSSPSEIVSRHISSSINKKYENCPVRRRLMAQIRISMPNAMSPRTLLDGSKVKLLQWGCRAADSQADSDLLQPSRGKKKKKKKTPGLFFFFPRAD